MMLHIREVAMNYEICFIYVLSHQVGQQAFKIKTKKEHMLQ